MISFLAKIEKINQQYLFSASTAVSHIHFFALNVLQKLDLVSWTIYSYITLKYHY